MEADMRRGALQAADAYVRHIEEDLRAGREPRRDQIAHEFVLPVDGDGLSPGELREVDVMALAAETQVNPVMDETFPLHALADAGLRQQLRRAVLQHTRADAALAVIPAAVFDLHGPDAALMEQVPQQQSCGARADDSHLCFDSLHLAFLPSARRVTGEARPLRLELLASRRRRRLRAAEFVFNFRGHLARFEAPRAVCR